MAAMVKHLASLAEGRLILSFAPSTPALLLLKRIGEFFPKGSKVSPATQTSDSAVYATRRAYMVLNDESAYTRLASSRGQADHVNCRLLPHT